MRPWPATARQWRTSLGGGRAVLHVSQVDQIRHATCFLVLVRVGRRSACCVRLLLCLCPTPSRLSEARRTSFMQSRAYEAPRLACPVLPLETEHSRLSSLGAAQPAARSQSCYCVDCLLSRELFCKRACLLPSVA